MENQENLNEVKCIEHKNNKPHTLSIVAISLSVISIAFSTFTLGYTISSKGNNYDNITNTNNTCPMQNNCPNSNSIMPNMGRRTANRKPNFYNYRQTERPFRESKGPDGQEKQESNNAINNN